MKMRKNKKAQEEMIGFIVIAIIVTIAAVILLLFSLRKPIGVEANKNVENFLYSSLKLTTECSKFGEMLDLQELLIACYDNEACETEETSESACTVLNETLKSITDTVLKFEGYSGYLTRVYAKEKDEEGKESITEILKLESGNLSENSEASDVFIPYYREARKNLHIYLKFYK